MTNDDPTLLDKRKDKERAVARIDVALATIKAQGREPDQWERVMLAQAISGVFRGVYRLAAAEASLAMTPKEERSPVANLPMDEIFDRCDMRLLREALEEAKLEPVKKFPILGPTVFVQN